MPPFLCRGHPVGQQVRVRHHVAYFCRCQECVLHTVFNPLTSQFVSGREFGKGDFQRHQQQMNSELHPNDDPANLRPSPSLFSSLGPDPDDSSIITDTFLLQLQSELKSRREKLQNFRGLLFLNPPPQPHNLSPPPKPSSGRPLASESSSAAPEASHSEINHGPFALDFGRQVNQHVLDHLQWLQDITLDLDSVTISPEMRGARKALIDEIEEEILRVEKKKADEWHRQYDEQSRARSLVKEGRVTVIDTGNFFQWNNCRFGLMTFRIYSTIHFAS